MGRRLLAVVANLVVMGFEEIIVLVGPYHEMIPWQLALLERKPGGSLRMSLGRLVVTFRDATMLLFVEVIIVVVGRVLLVIEVVPYHPS